MKLFILLFIILLFSYACNSGNVRNSLELTKSSNKTNEKIGKDSIRMVAKNIINGDRIWGKNEKYLFAIMDSLTNENSSSRAFYFKTFGKICEQADGYVAETIGQYVLQSFELYPSEFLQNSNTLSDTVFNSMGYEAGLEISMNEDNPFKTVDNLIFKATKELKNICDADRSRLDIFFNKMKEGVKAGLE